MSQELTAETLARYLAEEFEGGFWGDIDPNLFRSVADPGEFLGEDAEDLKILLQTVVDKIKNKASATPYRSEGT